MASKKRPGPHRDKREAMKEARAAKFKGVEHAVKTRAGVMAKPVNLVRYDMSSFLESCVENYCNFAKVSPSSFKEVPTPFTKAGIARPTLSDDEKPGKLQRVPVASKIVMKILFVARMATFDLLRATQSLASRVMKWSVECDVALHRLVSYINSSKDHFLEGFIGDSFDQCQLWLFADAIPPENMDSKSTSGSAIVLVGPNFYFPLNAFSKKQTVGAISSTEAEVVAANHSMRAEGIPMLALFEQLNLFKKLQGKPARDTAKPDADPVFTRTDPEIDEIRNGNVDTDCSVADINSLKASFPKFYQVKLMEDNQATITVMSALTLSASMTRRRSRCWNRADSNIEPSVYDQSAPAPSASSPKAAPVTLVARDDKDLGDEADASSGRPDASAAADDSATSTTRKRDQAEVSRSAADEQAEQPPSRVRRAFISANTEPYIGDCPVCMVEFVSGQSTCTTCGYEPLPVD